ncbi:MAG: hypothetical protein LLG14_20355 [Nocardiaceae bacterium]|nr:hypothetical protein [Nocardiaceae bacterium]
MTFQPMNDPYKALFDHQADITSSYEARLQVAEEDLAAAKAEIEGLRGDVKQAERAYEECRRCNRADEAESELADARNLLDVYGQRLESVRRALKGDTDYTTGDLAEYAREMKDAYHMAVRLSQRRQTERDRAERTLDRLHDLLTAEGLELIWLAAAGECDG